MSTLITLLPWMFEPGSTGYPQLALQTRRPVLTFIAEEECFFSFPRTDVFLQITDVIHVFIQYVYLGGSVGQDVRFEVAFEILEIGDTHDWSTQTDFYDIDGATQTITVDNGHIDILDILIEAELDTIEPDTHIRMRLKRKLLGANNFTGTLHVISVEIRRIP